MVHRARFLVALAVVGCEERPPPADCLVFVGDVALSRGVAAEIGRRGDPWQRLPRRAGDAFVGNLEGAVAAGSCEQAICLGIEPGLLDYAAQVPFAALGLANNHSHDFGDAQPTVDAIEERGIQAITDVGLFTHGGLLWGLVAVDLDGHSDGLEAALRRVHRAAAQADVVAVMPHWGMEYEPQPAPGQEHLAERFHAWGADLVLGAGAHVVQAHDCGTWLGLGDHLFDQRPESTHTGQAVRCCPHPGGLSCTTWETRRGDTSTFPEWAGAQDRCELRTDTPDRRWMTHPQADRFVTVEPLPAAGPDAFIALRRYRSGFDDEEALRPYVFRMTSGGVLDLWRGTALARPLVAIRVQGDLLCALHRDDSFLQPDPGTTGRHWQAYTWNGFGFDGAAGRCED